MATSIELVPFDKQQIATVRNDNSVYVVMKPIADRRGPRARLVVTT